VCHHREVTWGRSLDLLTLASCPPLTLPGTGKGAAASARCGAQRHQHTHTHTMHTHYCISLSSHTINNQLSLQAKTLLSQCSRAYVCPRGSLLRLIWFRSCAGLLRDTHDRTRPEEKFTYNSPQHTHTHTHYSLDCQLFHPAAGAASNSVHISTVTSVAV